jgi:hypothetical protein
MSQASVMMATEMGFHRRGNAVLCGDIAGEMRGDVLKRINRPRIWVLIESRNTG